MSRLLTVLTLLSTVGFARESVAACYTIYKNDVAIYQSTVAPVDMALPLSQSVPAKFGAGTSMIFNDLSNACLPIEAKLSGSPTGVSKRQVTSRSNRKIPTQVDAVQSSGVSPLDASIFEDMPESSGGSSSSGGGSFNPGPILTGPRGGQYYINSHSHKTYVSSGGSGRGGRR